MKIGVILTGILLLAVTALGQTTATTANHFTYAQKQVFFKAVKSGDLARVMEFVDADRAWVSVRDERDHGVLGLHVAKTAEVATCLLDHGADMEALDTNHLATPLRWAAGDNRFEVVKYLRLRGAKVEDIYLAAAIGEVKLVGEFLDKDAKLIEAPGLKCDLLGDGEHVKDFKEIGTGTALIAAINGRQLACVKLLIDRGADVNKRGGYAFATPLHHAAFGGNADIVALLIESGAEIEAMEEKHQGTPLQWAVVSGKKATVKALLSAGAKVSPSIVQNAVDGSRGGLKGITNEKPEVFKEIIEMLKKPVVVQK
jgi:hypothetical protein